ncbi:MAG: SLC13 family permease [Peptococcaceae bacterium]
MQTSLSTNPKGIDKKNLIFWIITFALPLAIMLIPVSEVFTAQLRLFLAITLCAIFMFAFEAIPNLIPALLLPTAYLLTNLAPAQAIFGPWSTYIPWMFLGGILMANCLETTGLLKRIAYWSIIKTGGTYNGILYGILLAGIILNLLIPAQAVIPLAAFTYGICMALDLGKSKEAAGIMLAGAFAALLPMFFFYNPNFAVIIGAASPVYPVKMTWFTYLFHNLPNIPWAVLCIFIISKVFKPGKPIDVKEFITEEYRKLGTMSGKEKKAIFVCLLLVAFLMTGGLHGIEIGWGFVIAAALMYFPGINVGTDEDIKRINYPIVFFCTACMAIGSVANALGFGKILAQLLLPVMSSSGTFGTIGLVWVLCVVGNFLMTPLAIMAAFSGPLAEVALNLGIDPLAFFYTIFHGVDQILFPYEYILYLVYFAFGLIRIKDFVKIFGIKMVTSIAVILLVLVPYWKLIGLL